MEEAKKVVKLTVNLSEEAYEALKSLADQQKTTVTDALRKAIGTEKYVRDQQASGAKILVQDTDKNIQQLVFR